MKYRKKGVFEAHRWLKNGDHPKDNCRVVTPVPGDGEPFLSEGKVVRRYRHPELPGTDQCLCCGKLLHDHGWIDQGDRGLMVCPGDYVITTPNGYVVVRERRFLEEFEPIPEPPRPPMMNPQWSGGPGMPYGT